MDLNLVTLDAQFADLDGGESASQEVDAMISALGPVPPPLPGMDRPAELVSTELDEDAFDASILAAYLSAR